MRVASILKIKGTAVMTVRANETVQAVAKHLHREGVGALIVCSGRDQLDGVISERDVAVGLAIHGSGITDLAASALMSTSVVTCFPDDSVTDVARIMTERRLRHIPVKDGRRLVGVVSIGDVLKFRLDEAQLENRVLRDITRAMR